MATIALAVTGGAITDAVRIAGVEGDGRAPEGSTGVWGGTQNLHPNPGFETDLEWWAPYGTATPLERSNVAPKFGNWCCLVTDGAESADFASISSTRQGNQSLFIDAPAGATFTVTFLVGGVALFTDSNYAPGTGWRRFRRYFAPPASSGLATLRVVRNGGGTFRIDGVQTEVNANAFDPTHGNPGTPYAHRDDNADVWPGQPNLHPNGDFETDAAGWVGFGTITSMTRSTVSPIAGAASLLVVTPATANVGVRSVDFAALTPGKLYAIELRLVGPPGEAYKVEATAGGVRVAIDFGWAPASGKGRRVLLFTAPAVSPGSCTLIVSKNSANAISFRLDVVKLKVQPGTTPPAQATGSRLPAAVAVPAAGIMSATRMWFAWRGRPGFGAADPGDGSTRLMRWYDDDWHRVECFVATASSGVLGVRRSTLDAQYLAAQITSAERPFVRDGISTVIGQWTPTQAKASVDGSAFGAYALSTRDIPGIPTITNPVFEIAGGGFQDVFWFGAGQGELTDADCAWLHAFGDAGPAPGDFAPRFDLRFLWDGNGTSAWKADAIGEGGVRDIGGLGGGMIHAYVGRPVTVEFWTGAAGDVFAPVVESGGPGGSWSPTFAALGGGWHSLTHTFGAPGRWYAVLEGSVSGQTLVAQVKVSPIVEAPAFTRVTAAQTIQPADINGLQAAIEALAGS